MARRYPDGYADLPWTTPEEFASEVIPTRAEALTETLNAALPDWARDAGLRLEWSRPTDDPIGASANTGPGYDLAVISDVLRRAHIAHAHQRRERDRMGL